MIRVLPLLTALCVPSFGVAQDLALPGNAIATHQEAGAPDTMKIATGAWADGSLPSLTAEGMVSQNAWKISVAGLTTMQILLPIREQLIADGYETLFTCQDDACGGFDFRFALNILPPPKMQVNLGNFRYWAGTKIGDDGREHLALLISRIARTAYVQIDRVSRNGTQPRVSTRGQSAVAPIANAIPTDVIDALNAVGRAVLDDLSFAPGSAALADGKYGTLAALAVFLRVNPNLQVALVGHTDSAGSLEGNIWLSKRRARAVRQRLINVHGVRADQVAAEGMGYLSPVGSNLTEIGRNANRRVEVIVTSTDAN